MHRWHHSRDPGTHHCNYGNNFSIFDWVFGTAYVSYARDAEFGIDDDDRYRDFESAGRKEFRCRRGICMCSGQMIENGAIA